MGTPDFAVPALEQLQASQHEIKLVVTVPDTQQGRGRQEKPSAVKSAALKLGLPILQPARLKDPELVKTLAALEPDLIIVVAFKILPEEIFLIPRLGAFNLHASLLPRYRGAAPIHWALMNGDQESGVSTFFLKRKVDTGNIIMQSSVAILETDNLYTLYDKLCHLGADVVLETVDLIASGPVNEGIQDEGKATPAPKVTNATRQLNFEQTALNCHNRVRAFAPRPGAFTYRDGVLIKILSTSVSDLHGAPGHVIEVTTASFTIACSEGALTIHLIQPESKRAMDASAYLRGNPLSIGDTFG